MSKNKEMSNIAENSALTRKTDIMSKSFPIPPLPPFPQENVSVYVC